MERPEHTAPDADVTDLFADIPQETQDGPAPLGPVPEDLPSPERPVESQEAPPKGQESPPQRVGQSDSSPKEERRMRETAEKLFSFVEKYPQTRLAVGGSREEDGKRLLRANASGSVTLASAGDSGGLITVEFADAQRMKKRVLENTHGFSLADIGDSAFVLASAGALENVDEYEEDRGEEGAARAVLYFCNAARETTWSVELPAGDALLDVCLSSRLVFAFTGDNLVRGFDYGKNEVFQASLEAPVVALCAFEHFLGVAYLTGLPAQGMQAMRVRVFNAEEMRADFDVPVALSPYKKLQWLGFGDDGALYSQDTADCVRVLTAQHLWVPVFHNARPRKFWLLGVLDNDLVGYHLAEGELSPNPHFRYQPASLKRKVDVLTDRNSDRQAALLLRRIDVAAAARTLHEFAFMKQTETTNPLRQIFRGRIRGPAELHEDHQGLETDKVELIRRLLVEGHADAAVHAALQLRSLPHFQVVLTLLETLKEKKTREELTRLAHEFGFFDRVAVTGGPCAPSVRQSQATPALSEERRAELHRFVEEHQPSQARPHSFHDFKAQARTVPESVPEEPRPEPARTQTARATDRPAQGSSIMGEFGQKQRKLRP